MIHHQRSICRVGFEMRVWELFGIRCSTESSLDSSLLFVRFVFFFLCLLQWLLVLLFEAVETPTRRVEMERKCWTKRNCNPMLRFLEQIFIFGCVCWNYCLQICSLFCTLKDHHLHAYDYINALPRMSTPKAHTHCCVRLAKLSEDSSGLLSWKH